MNFEDDVLLAYLDGGLDPRTRRQVLEASRTEPSVAARLTILVEVRARLDLLPRPKAPPEVAANLMEWVEAGPIRREARHSVRKARQRQAMTIVPIATAAAAFLALWLGGGLKPPQGPVPPQNPRDRVAGLDRPDFRPPIKVEPIQVADPTANFVGPIAPEGLLADRAKASRAVRDRLTALTATADPLRIRLVADRLDEDGLAPIEDALRNWPRARPSHFRVGLPADPDVGEPEAVVYVVELDPIELGPLRRKLAEARTSGGRPLAEIDFVPDRVDANRLGRLASARSVERFEDPSQAAGSILETTGLPRSEMALMEPDRPGSITGEVTFGPDGRRLPSRHGGSPRPFVSTPTSIPANLDHSMPTGPPRIYLIWVTKAEGPIEGK